MNKLFVTVIALGLSLSGYCQTNGEKANRPASVDMSKPAAVPQNAATVSHSKVRTLPASDALKPVPVPANASEINATRPARKAASTDANAPATTK